MSRASRKGERTVGPSYYGPNEVRRDTVVVLKEGRPVFELTGPDGWRYSTRTLDDDCALATAGTDGIADVLMDDLGNSHQRRG